MVEMRVGGCGRRNILENSHTVHVVLLCNLCTHSPYMEILTKLRLISPKTIQALGHAVLTWGHNCGMPGNAAES